MKIAHLFPAASLLLLLTPLTLTAACATTTHVIDPNADGGGAVDPAQSSSDTLPSVADAPAFCTSLCDREQACDNSLDQQTCKNDCINREAAVFPKLRSDVVGLIVQCFGSKDCKSVLTGDVIATCAAEGVASVAPTEAAATYCNAYSDAKTKCGSTTTATKAACLDQAKLYSDDAIGEAQHCTGRPCNDMDTCVAASFGGLGAVSPKSSSSTSTGTTTTCGSGQFSELGSCETCAETTCCAAAAACAADSMCRSGMSICSQTNGQSTSCNSYMQSTSTTTRQLLGTYFNCASTSSSSTSSCAGCGFITQ